MGVVRVSRRDRGQLVLAAAAVLAIALAPVVFAYLQLGYAGDVRATGGYADPAGNAERVLSRAVHGASAGVPRSDAWAEREEAADEVRTDLGPRIATLETARVERGTVYTIGYNGTAARDWLAAGNCPGGPDRQFGACERDGGLIVQNRSGRTHVVAVAFDVRVTTPDGEMRTTSVFGAVDG